MTISSMDNPLFSPKWKRADIPETMTELESPVSKEHDLVNRVLQWYIDNRTEEMPWKDFQKKFPFAQNSPLFTGIRRNGPVVTRAQLEHYLENEEPPLKDYGLTTDKYYDPEQSYRDVEKSLVLQINHGAYSQSIMEEDPMLGQYIGFVGRSSTMSGHPANENTVGWLRLDFVNKDWLLVDEVQSDLINSVGQARAILESPSFNDFIAHMTNPHVREMAMAKMSEGADQILEQEAAEAGGRRGRGRRRTREQVMEERYQQGRNYLTQQGYTVEGHGGHPAQAHGAV